MSQRYSLTFCRQLHLHRRYQQQQEQRQTLQNMESDLFVFIAWFRAYNKTLVIYRFTKYSCAASDWQSNSHCATLLCHTQRILGFKTLNTFCFMCFYFSRCRRYCFYSCGCRCCRCWCRCHHPLQYKVWYYCSIHYYSSFQYFCLYTSEPY